MAIVRAVGRSLFGDDPQSYARARPDYPERVYDILRERCGARSGTRAFDVGAGTGQATACLLDMGCSVTAIEPDARLSDYLKQNVSSDRADRLNVIPTPFEDATAADMTFDLGVAATSFHWLDTTAPQKIARWLKPGGWWAMWWNHFGDPLNPGDFQNRVQHLFEPLERSPSYGGSISVPFALDEVRRRAELDAAGFSDVEFEAIRWTITMTTHETVALTRTFSPVARLSPDARQGFLDALAGIADREFGGRVSRNFMTAIYTARKP